MRQRMFQGVEMRLQPVGQGSGGETLLHNGLQHTPAIAEGTQITLSIYARMLYTGYLNNFEMRFAHAQADLRLDLEAAAIYLHIGQAIFPEGIVAITQIAEM